MTVRFRDEYLRSSLGDSRRGDRLVDLAMSLSTSPGLSFPQTLGDGAKLEGAYRFLNNRAVNDISILEPHIRESAARCAEAETFVIAHDTTSVTFSGLRDGLGPIQGADSACGFNAHVALAVSFDGFAEPLGVLHLEQWTRIGERKRANKLSPRKRRLMPDNESRRWYRGVIATENMLTPGCAIHVMDREADMYDLFATMTANKQRFVVRSAHDRRLADEDCKLHERLLSAPTVITREIPISKRKGSKLPRTRKTHPPRNARMATLEVKALEVRLRRPRDLKSITG